MEKKIVFDLAPTKENARNSEGAFIRTNDGRILFAYSRFDSSFSDNAHSDIYCIYSDDEGETWQDLGFIARAKDFGVENIMSVSSMRLKDGSIAFFFLIKESINPEVDGPSSIGMAVSKDGINFEAKRCNCNFEKGWFVINNDRFIRLSDGRIAAPICQHSLLETDENGKEVMRGITTRLQIAVSDDEGENFYLGPKNPIELQEKHAIVGTVQEEPGLMETEPGKFILWARTNTGSQFVTRSDDWFDNFAPIGPSEFVSPQSPMSMIKDGDDIYAVYNPNPAPRFPDPIDTLGRTQLIIRRSTDKGKTFGEPHYIETDLNRGFCYVGLFATNDDSILAAYCAGSKEDNYCLNRLRITKFKKNSF